MVILLTDLEKEQYKQYGVNIKSKYFKSLYEQGLLDLTGINYDYIKNIQSYYKKHFKNEIDTRDHIVYYNVTGKEDVRVIPTGVLRGGAKGGYLINYFNDRGMINAYSDKSLYDNLFSDFNRAYNVIKRVRGQYMTRDGRIISKEQIDNLLLEDSDEYIIKKSDTDDGKSIAKLRIKNKKIYLKGKKTTLDTLERLYGSNFLIQRVIQQHSTMARLHPSSVNTLRMVTLRWNGEINYLYTFTRFGVNNDVKDNAGSGGLVVGVKDNGEFMDYGIFKNKKVKQHPTTQEAISQLGKVPNFEECKNMVLSMHERIIHQDFASWDIAVEKDGTPIFIEVNFFGTALLNQLALERPLFGDLTAEILEEASSSFSKILEKNTDNFYSKLNKRYRAKSRENLALKKENKVLKNELKLKDSMTSCDTLLPASKRPLIGMLRYFKKPNSNIEHAAKEANRLGCDFVLFHPEDVNVKTQQITGLWYRNGEWIRLTSGYPDVIDNAKSRPKYREIFRALESSVPFTTYRIGNKDVIADRLVENKTFAPLVIPYELLQTVEQVFDHLEQYEKVIVKPTNQRNGRGIHFIMKYEEEYVYHDGIEGYIVDRDTLYEKVKPLVKPQTMIQPFIHSMTKEGQPFDIRIHVRRNGQGEWEVLKIYPRLGELGSVCSTKKSIVSEEYSLEQLLSENFKGIQAENILAEIKALASLFPEKLQKNYTNRLDALGIDLGIDTRGKLWIFEVNTAPAAEGFEKEALKLAVDYGVHLISGEKEVAPVNSSDKKLTIAMFSNSARLNELKRACGALASFNNYRFIFFTPKSMDFQNKTVKGYEYIEGEWQRKKYNYLTDIDVIYDRVRRKGIKKYQPYYKELSSIVFTHQNSCMPINKFKVAKEFGKYEKIQKWMIPSENYKIEVVIEYLARYKNIILKPQQDSYGRGLYLLEEKGNDLVISNKHNKKIIKKTKLKEWLENNISTRKYIVQPYICSRTKENSPSDIRVHLVRNGNGEWTILEIYPRVGIEYEKITPMTEGGYRGRWKGFAIHQYGINDYKRLTSELQEASLELIDTFEEAFGTKLTEVGFDFLINEKKELLFLEINVRQPGVAFYDFRLAQEIMDYAGYLYEETLKKQHEHSKLSILE